MTVRSFEDNKIILDKMFKEIGFSTRAKHVLDTKNKLKWKREFGTLFVIGKKL